MPANNKKLELRSLLAGKTTEELEELLALDFAEDKKNVDADYISTILEVIEERENSTGEGNEQTLAAWSEFQAYQNEKGSCETLEAGKSEEPTHDHRRIIEYRQKPRKHSAAFRLIAVAAAAMILLCSTAFGLNIWQVIVEWTEETFHFLTGQEISKQHSQDEFEILRTHVSELTDIPAVPHFAPEGTKEFGTLNVIERDDRCAIGMGYTTGDKSFTIQIIIYKYLPDNYDGVYQKDATIQEEYVVGGIKHYIAGNLENLSCAWTNGNVEGYIQGELTLDEMRQMIDSIYEE